MAEDINRVVVVGRLGKDAEGSYTQSGYALLKFSIASNRRRKQGDQWVDEANWFDIVVWGRQGEAIAQYMTKGKQVAVEGKLKQDKWTAQDGSNRSKIVIEADNVQLLGGREDGQGNQGYGQRNNGYGPAPSGAAAGGGSAPGWGGNQNQAPPHGDGGFGAPPAYTSQPTQGGGGFGPGQGQPAQNRGPVPAGNPVPLPEGNTGGFESDIPF